MARPFNEKSNERISRTVLRDEARRPIPIRIQKLPHQHQDGGGSGIIEYQIDSVDCEARIATATVISVPCAGGAGVSIGDTISLCDASGCFLTGPEEFLTFRTGFATQLIGQNCDSIYGTLDGCVWRIISMCDLNFGCITG